MLNIFTKIIIMSYYFLFKYVLRVSLQKKKVDFFPPSPSEALAVWDS